MGGLIDYDNNRCGPSFDRHVSLFVGQYVELLNHRMDHKSAHFQIEVVAVYSNKGLSRDYQINLSYKWYVTVDIDQ